MASSPRSSSPTRIYPDLIRSLKDGRETLVTNKNELCTLPIPKLKEALVKLAKLLEFSQKVKGNEDAVSQLVGLAERLNQTTCTPILAAKRKSPFSISAELTSTLCTLFSAIDASIPSLTRSSRIGHSLGWMDAGSIVVAANTNIETALNIFLQQGEIQQTGRGQLVQSQGATLSPASSIVGILPSPIQGPTNQSLGAHPSDLDSVSQMAEASGDSSQLDQLPSQVQRVLIKCPRFRILLLGKSGAGKSSLINQVFKVKSAEIAHYQAGRAEINQEHTSESNPYFVLHDSMGFESGSLEKYHIVENFIKERSGKAELTDQLHAIWLCTAIPVGGGRVFESGDEQIFSLNLRNVPLIVVFTQYDKLVTRTAIEQTSKTKPDNDQARRKADEYFQGLCAYPLKQICAGSGHHEAPPFTKVSVKRGYADTLSELIKLTRSLLPPDARAKVPPDLGFPELAEGTNEPLLEVEDNTATDIGGRRIQPNPLSAVGVTLAIAQRVDPSTKIEAIITIGRQRYWKGLALSLDFRGRRLDKCTEVVHGDIVKVWNFFDPNKYLASARFKSVMSQIVEDLTDEKRGGRADHAGVSPTTKLAALFSTAAGVTGLMAAVAPPSAVIVAPLALTAIFAKWMYDSYQHTPEVVRCLMGYIVDLTIVMRRLFWIMEEKGGIHPISESDVKKAADEYHKSTDKEAVHQAIVDFVTEMKVLERARKDVVFGEIARLIRDHRFEPNVSPS